MRIIIETIPHEQQRYPTVGDWQFIGDDLVIKVSKFPKVEHTTDDEYYEFLVGIHELIEAMLCKAFSISGEQVDYFDMSHPELDDPGSNLAAPYYRQHLFATIIERMIADELDVDWNEYGRILEEL